MLNVVNTLDMNIQFNYLKYELYNLDSASMHRIYTLYMYVHFSNQGLCIMGYTASMYVLMCIMDYTLSMYVHHGLYTIYLCASWFIHYI